MHDKRVVRGNTYAARDILREEEAMNNRENDRNNPFGSTIRRRTRRKAKTNQVMEEKVPSHELLEELPAPISITSSTQTADYENAMEELHPTAYMPKPSGYTRGTEIEETDLFDFDLSVLPILEVIIGKSLDQGKLEVLQEEQVKILQHNKKIWKMERNATFTEAQRLQAELQRHQEERDRRLAQGIQNIESEKFAQRLQDAKDCTKETLSTLQEGVVKRLAKAGHFYDPTSSQIEGAFVPWLVERIVRGLAKESTARAEVDGIITGACAGIVEEMNEKLRAEREEQERIAQELREAEEEKQRIKEEEEAARLAEEEEKKKKIEDAERAAEEAAERARKLFEEGEEDE